MKMTIIILSLLLCYCGYRQYKILKILDREGIIQHLTVLEERIRTLETR